MAAADWYFDFVSPFAYLASERLGSLAPAIRVRHRPVLFAALLDANGQKGPAEIAAKRAFTYRFVVWQARRWGIPVKFPHVHPFNPLPLLRLAIACDCRPDAVQRIFRFVWRDGRLPDLPIEWAELAHDLGVPDAAARIGDPQVGAALDIPGRDRPAVGAGATRYPEAFVDRRPPEFPDPGVLARLVAARIAAEVPIDVSPLYLRRPDAVAGAPRKRVTPT